jgi:hypothetical protein
LLAIEPSTLDNNNQIHERAGILVRAPVCAANDSVLANQMNIQTVNTSFNPPRPLSPQETAKRDAKADQMRAHEKVIQQQRRKLEEAIQRKRELCDDPHARLTDEEYYSVIYG